MAMNGSFRTLTFDGEISTDYGVYISGEGTFNAPLRDVEMITIPGRNGAYALDNGRFENIEVTYPAGLFGVDEADFAEKISAFRNFLCSRVGYVRLEDDYNPDEYRLAIYKSGLEVDPELLKAGRFDLVFECKPQRFLKSGESEITLSAGSNTVTNPTLFNSRPLFKAQGYGDIIVNNEAITIENKEIGLVDIPFRYLSNGNVQIDANILNPGDVITVSGANVIVDFSASAQGCQITDITYVEWSKGSGTVSASGLVLNVALDSNYTFQKGTDSAIIDLEVDIVISNGVNSSDYTLNLTVAYYLAVNDMHLIYTYTELSLVAGTVQATAKEAMKSINSITGVSTKTITDIIYIDLDIGEAYIIDDGQIAQINEIVSIPADLPELNPGANNITVNGENITQAKVVPRWWKV